MARYTGEEAIPLNLCSTEEIPISSEEERLDTVMDTISDESRCRSGRSFHFRTVSPAVGSESSYCTSNRCLLFAFVIEVVVTVLILFSIWTFSDKFYFEAAVTADAGVCSEILSDKCYSTAAVAADAKNCSEIGRDMLERNGTAVDAAIAALLCMSLYNPQSMGIGGGVVFTIYNASSGNVETISARETAPRASTQNMFENKTYCNDANKASYIAVPGELRGYEMAHNRHGILPWEELFEPSIKLATEGIKIGKDFAEAIEDEDHILCDNALWGFWSYITGGNITREDLMYYEAKNEHALNFTLRNYTFHAPTAPFGGPVLALILNILLEGYNFTNTSVSTENKTLTYHRMIEAFHLADVEKSKLGDPLDENITEIVLQIVQNMTSVDFAADIRAKINDSIKRVSYGCSNEKFDSGTSHLSVIDKYGNAVAVTSSINDAFGSRVMSDSTGIVFNNQMDDFMDPDMMCEGVKNNLIKPGKRPLSSMCPTIILDQDKKVKMVVGGAGGTNITTAVAQVIMNYLFFGYDDLEKAVTEPRIQIRGDETFVEIKNLTKFEFLKEVIKGLEQKNHEIKNHSEISVIQAIVREGDTLCAESEREGGYPAGY